MTRGPKDFTDVMSGLIALIVIGVSLALGAYSIIAQVPGADDWRGAFLVAFAGSIAYWVGSSSGSKRKSDAVIADKVADDKVVVVAADKVLMKRRSTDSIKRRSTDSMIEKEKEEKEAVAEKGKVVAVATKAKVAAATEAKKVEEKKQPATLEKAKRKR